MTFDAMLALFTTLVRFDKGRAGAKNSREGEKQSADGRAPNIGEDAGDKGRRSAEGKTDCVLVPAAFFQRGQFEADDHELADRQLFEAESGQQPNGKR
jgi:hypothetical protein